MTAAGRPHEIAATEALTGAAPRVAIVASRFNETIVSLLEEGCLAALADAGVSLDDTALVRVPGAFELPLACHRLAASGAFEAVIALGAVIRGETPHFDYVCEAANAGILNVGLETGVPVIFGVITTDNEAHALARARRDELDKGGDSARAALEMIGVMRELDARLPAAR